MTHARASFRLRSPVRDRNARAAWGSLRGPLADQSCADLPLQWASKLTIKMTSGKNSLKESARRAWYRIPSFAAAVATLSISSIAWGAEPDDATKATARDLAQRAAMAYDSSDYQTAQDLFHRAYALVPAPTLSVREARALEKLGRWVEAVEAYVRTLRSELGPDAPDVFVKAQRDARQELADLRPRVPRLKVVLEGAAASGSVIVTLDGRPLRPALIGVDTLADPGQHTVDAAAPDGTHSTEVVTLAEADSKTVVLRISATTASTSNAPQRPGLDVVANHRPEPPSAQRTWGFVALGIGIAGVGAGAVTGLLAADRHASAEQSCPGDRCLEGSAGADDVEAFRTLRTASIIAYVTGAIGVGLGTTLLITAPPKTKRWAYNR